MKPSSHHIDGIFIAWIIFIISLLIFDIFLSSWNCHKYVVLVCSTSWSPSLHYSTVLTAAGTSVAFVLTYLAVRSGQQPAVGELLLRSALHEIKTTYPELYQVFDDNLLTDTEMNKIEQFIDDREDEFENLKSDNKYINKIDRALTGLALLRHIFNFAKPPYQRSEMENLPDPEDFGYGLLRSAYTRHILYKKDTEDQIVHYSVLTVGGVVLYAGISILLQFLGFINITAGMICSYTVLTIISVVFSFMLTLRLWPQPELGKQLSDFSYILDEQFRLGTIEDIISVPDPI